MRRVRTSPNWARSSCKPPTATTTDGSRSLSELRTPLETEIAAFIKKRIKSESARREHVETHRDVPSAELGRVAGKRAAQFAAVYGRQHGIADELNGPSSYPPPLTPPAQWPSSYVGTLMSFITAVEWHLHKSIGRLTGTVGRELPAYVVEEFLPKVPATLREAFGLNDVQGGVRKRAAGLCEPDEEVVLQREVVKKRRKALEVIQ